MINKYFKILAPFNAIEDLAELKDAGADELYCGFIGEKLAEKWPAAFVVINRRGESQSFESYPAFEKAIARASRLGLPVFVTVNGLYTPEQYPLLLEMVDQIACLEGVKGIIVADVGLLLTLRKRGFKKEIHISTGGTCFNSGSADFFSSLGASRVVLDRQLTSSEVASVIDGISSGIAVELFIMNEGCGGFIDGFCTFFHCVEKAREEEIMKGFVLRQTYNLSQEKKGCDFYFLRELANGRFKTYSADSYKEKNIGLKFDQKKNISCGCRLCDLYDFNRAPVKSLKIVGRGNAPGYTAEVIRLISRALSWLDAAGITRKEYQRKCREAFSKLTFDGKMRCTDLDCYFSTHWTGNENKI